jgi:SNF2 family DNA or RNA helicase
VWAGDVHGRRGPKKNPSVAERAEALIQANTAALQLGTPFAAVVNLEAAAAGQMAELLLGTDWDLVIVDESHRIKSASGVQSKFVGRLCRRIRMQGGRVLALTGTPMPHSPLDLWAQFRALDQDLLGTSWTAFRARYGAPKVHYTTSDGEPVYLRTPGGQVIYDGVRPDRLDELTGKVAPLMFQVDADELDRQLGLDEPVDLYRTTRLSTASQRVYDALERELIAEIAGGGVVTAANAMVNVIRLAQATSGYAVDADTGAHRPLCNPPEKAQLLADLLADLPVHEPVVVFARFHHDLDAIRKVCEAQGRTYGELSGRHRDGLTDTSTMNPSIDVLGAQLKSGGVGIDLTRSRYGIYYSLDFNLADAMQSRKRLHRPGQQHRVTYIHLLAENTVDRAIYGALARREEVITAVLDRLKNRSMQ